jgi:ABC-type Na+ transport system ATPase subunit NatA
MENFRLEYTGPEALEICQQYYGANFNKSIQDCQKTLTHIANAYKLELKEAYKKYLSYGCRKESSILFFAALHLLLEDQCKEKRSIYEQIKIKEELQMRYINNLEAVEYSKEHKQSKQTLRAYFAEKRDCIQLEIEELISSIPVRDAHVLRIQTGLFDK